MKDKAVENLKGPTYTSPQTAPPLDDTLYELSLEELEFFKAQTLIDNEDVLKQHIIAVQKKAYGLYGYPCIRLFLFTKLNISNHFAYQRVIKLCRLQEEAILLDVGCCFGTDIRKAVFDGWPARNVVASDILQEFWDCGHELFKSTPDTFPVTFIAGDVFDSNIIDPQAASKHSDGLDKKPFAFPNLNTLIPLQAQVTAIHTTKLFHLFDEMRQLQLAQRLATLLSPVSGSVIFGSQPGVPNEKSSCWIQDACGDVGQALFLHSPDSWRELWDGGIFVKGTVRVESELKKFERPDLKGEYYDWLFWSVTRL